MFLLYTSQILYIYLLKNGINAVNKHHLLLFYLLFHISKCFILLNILKSSLTTGLLHAFFIIFATIKIIKLYIIKYYKLKTTRATKINKNNTKLTWIVIFIFYIIILRFNHNRYVNRDRRDVGKLLPVSAIYQFVNRSVEWKLLVNRFMIFVLQLYWR